jgi:hypothetical protein
MRRAIHHARRDPTSQEKLPIGPGLPPGLFYFPRYSSLVPVVATLNCACATLIVVTRRPAPPIQDHGSAFAEAPLRAADSPPFTFSEIGEETGIVSDSAVASG